MEIAKLVLEYVKALIWPAAFVFATLTFKTQIGGLFGRLRILRGGVAEAEFADAAADVRAETEVTAAEQQTSPDRELPGTDGTVMLTLQDVLDQLLIASPAVAVLSGWDHLRDRMVKMALALKPAGIDPSLVVSGTGVGAIPLLEEAGLPSATVRSIWRLLDLRNRVAHHLTATPMTQEAGRDYVDAAVNVWEALTAFEYRLRDKPTAE